MREMDGVSCSEKIMDYDPNAKSLLFLVMTRMDLQV
jgi:hypothetical protein